MKFTAFDDLPIAGLERKQKNAVPRNPKTRSHFRYIRSIEKVQNPVMQCIQMDSPSHMYLAGRSFVPTHNSELAAAVALLLTCGDGEERAEVYGCAADRQQATIVFDVAADRHGKDVPGSEQASQNSRLAETHHIHPDQQFLPGALCGSLLKARF